MRHHPATLLPATALFLALGVCCRAQAQQLPTWDCQRQGPCTYYHSSPASQGCDQQPPQCVPAAGGSTGSGAAGSIAGSEGCSARNKNYQGDVLVLDVNSMQYQGGPNHPPAVITALECCQACKKQAGCNGWTFCWRLDGCGSGCTVSCKPPSEIDPTKELGQFGSCAPGERFPFRTCTLKRLSDTANPPVWDDSTDWTSGAVVA